LLTQDHVYQLGIRIYRRLGSACACSGSCVWTCLVGLRQACAEDTSSGSLLPCHETPATFSSNIRGSACSLDTGSSSISSDTKAALPGYATRKGAFKAADGLSSCRAFSYSSAFKAPSTTTSILFLPTRDRRKLFLAV
jgi:hypothetical protein